MRSKVFDKSGKATACKLLTDRLIQDGYKAMKSEHHRYDQPTGDLIMKWLTGGWNVSQETIELIMTADKMAQQNWYQELENEKYNFLVLDRYILSQVVYAKASKVPLDWVQELQRFMRKPDIDIVIDISPEVSMSRKGKHNNGENDRYESDIQLLSNVRDNYIMLSEKYSAPLKFIIEGERSVESIHEDIYSIVQDNLIYGDPC